jgi:hypothetical protein
MSFGARFVRVDFAKIFRKDWMKKNKILLPQDNRDGWLRNWWKILYIWGRGWQVRDNGPLIRLIRRLFSSSRAVCLASVAH